MSVPQFREANLPPRKATLMSGTPSPSQNNYNDRGRAKGSVWGLTTNKSKVTFTDNTTVTTMDPEPVARQWDLCISLRPSIEIYQNT